MKKRILVVDDDPLVLKSLRNLLVRQGYEIECAEGGIEALERLRAGRFDLVLCDIRMPKKDGLLTVKELRQGALEEGRNEVPVIFMTGYASEEAPIDAIKLGVKDYILKPFDIDEILSSIRQQIG